MTFNLKTLTIMTDSTNKPNTPFWIIGIVALIWNLMGAFAYINQVTMTEEALVALPEAERAMYENVPAWATAAFAIAVFAGVLGCILLLLRKKLATTVLLISLAAILVQMFYNFFIYLGKATEVYGPGSIIMPVMVIIIGFFLVWHTRKSNVKGWLS